MKQENLIESVPSLWKFWESKGINTEADISILFKFYSAFDKESSVFAKELETRGYQVTRKGKRTLIFLKGFEITAERTKIWTQNELESAITELELLGQQNSTILEGYFAADPN